MRPSAASLAGAFGALALLIPSLSAPAERAAAAAATVQTDFSCYLQSRAVRVSGNGFTPGAVYTVSVDGTAVGPGTVKSDGSISGTLDSGRIGGAAPVTRALTVSQGSNQAQTTFQVTGFTARFSPSTGDPRTLLVRYSVYGFAPGSPDTQPLYLHYRSPSGNGGQTINIGHTNAPCGTVTHSRLRHLFPFSPRAGTWLLQFDTSPRYSPSSQPRVVRSVLVR
jgi:hypothetical protein